MYVFIKMSIGIINKRIIHLKCPYIYFTLLYYTLYEWLRLILELVGFVLTLCLHEISFGQIVLFVRVHAKTEGKLIL